MESGLFFDPGRPYSQARQTRALIEESREAIATLLDARPSEVVFVASSTEAINLAARSALSGQGRFVAMTAVERSAIKTASERYARVESVGVDGLGRVDLDLLEKCLNGHGDDLPPVLMHCQLANHEVATVQPISEVIATCKAKGVRIHIDADIAVGRIPVSFKDMGADMLSCSSQQIGGPPGVGALVVRRGLRIDPLVVGGDQERARHAGLENVLGIVGFAAAARVLSNSQIDKEARIALDQTKRLLEAALAVEGVTCYGDAIKRIPHLICLGIQRVESEGVVLGLDRLGISVHSGSACSSESFEPSPVLAAMGVAADRSLRVSVGWSTTNADIDAFALHFPFVVASLRALSAS